MTKGLPLECPVCLESIKTPRTLECGHCFHARCVSKWFARRGVATCPSCRRPALRWLAKSRAKLSTRLTAFVDTVEIGAHTQRRPGEFWPAWLSAQVLASESFDAQEKAFLRDISFQSFDRVSYFAMLRRVEAFERDAKNIDTQQCPHRETQEEAPMGECLATTSIPPQFPSSPCPRP